MTKIFIQDVHKHRLEKKKKKSGAHPLKNVTTSAAHLGKHFEGVVRPLMPSAARQGKHFVSVSSNGLLGVSPVGIRAVTNMGKIPSAIIARFNTRSA